MIKSHNGARHLIRDFYTAIQFNTGGVVNITDPPDLTGSWTYGIWIKLPNLTSESTLLNSQTNNSVKISIGTTGQIKLSAAGGSVLATSIGVVGINTWHYVAVRYDINGGYVRFFIDGEDAGSSSISHVFAQPVALTISPVTRSVCLRIALWSSVISQSNIRSEFYESTSLSPTHLFKCDDAIGSALLNSFGSTAANTSNVVFITNDLPTSPLLLPRGNGSIFLRDSTSYVQCSSNKYNLLMNGESKILLAGWCRLTADGSIISARTGTIHADLGIGGTFTVGTFRSQAADTAQASGVSYTSPNLSRSWKFLATEADFQNNKIRNYLNGVLIKELDVTFGSPVANYPSSIDFRLGQVPNGTGACVGLLGPQYIAAGNITRQLVRDLYVSATIPNLNKIAYWTMDDRSGIQVTQKGNSPHLFSAQLAGLADWSMETPV